MGKAPGEFHWGPHTLIFDSQGRLFVGGRANNRIRVFDQEGNFIAQWKQLSRPSAIFITKDNTMYVADSESTGNMHQTDEEGYGYNPGCQRGIRVGSTKTGEVTAFIPDPDPKGGTSASEGVAADHDGNIYGAEWARKTCRSTSRSRAVSAKGQIVTPRFIDLDAHCFDGVATGFNGSPVNPARTFDLGADRHRAARSRGRDQRLRSSRGREFIDHLGEMGKAAGKVVGHQELVNRAAVCRGQLSRVRFECPYHCLSQVDGLGGGQEAYASLRALPDL